MKYFIILLSILSIVSPTISAENKTYNVTYASGFTMHQLLGQITAFPKNKKDLDAFINAPWYDEFAMEKNVSLSSCKEYFKDNNRSLWTKHEYDYSPYLEIAVMCQATQLLSTAQPSHESYLPSKILTPNLPEKLPKALALVISASRDKEIAANNDIVFWSDVEKMTKYESVNNDQAIYHHHGGYQHMDVVGLGDFNHDGVQDIAIVVRDYVEGGSYFNMRLFALAVDANHNWSIIN